MNWTRNLKRGMSGDDVLAVKKQLFALGYYAPNVTKITHGVFGGDTVRAVKAFQTDVGLAVDGIVGALTWEGLFEQDAGEGAVNDADTPDAPGKRQEPSKKALAIVLLARERIGDIYVWGASGQSDLSDAAIKKRDDAAGAARSIKFRDKQVRYGYTDLLAHDCSGFISWLLREAGVWDTRRDCDGLWSLCTEIPRKDLIPGDLVFRVSGGNASDETHVGLYIGRGMVIHAKGRDVGVMLEGINENGGGWWHKCGRLGLLYE